MGNNPPSFHVEIINFIIVLDENGFKVADDSLCDEICLAR